ncbi:Beta-enolase [Capsicum chinense]|nr:Beta-enolase [Capsicum chinense]
MDVAVLEFLTKHAKYELNFKNQPNDGAHVLSSQGLCELYKEFVKDFSIVSIEDPFDQNDWSSWESLQSSVDIQLVGDDFLVTNPKRIAEAIQKKACNALLFKVNQTGTVTKSIQVALDSKVVGWGVMISHRSGKIEDNFIADLSVGLANGQCLQHVVTQRDMALRQGKWMEVIKDYDISISYHLGKANMVASSSSQKFVSMESLA